MSLKPEVLDALVAIGATGEMIAAAVKADQAADEARKAAKRANNAERQRRFQARKKAEQSANTNADHALCGVNNASSPSPNDPLPKPSNVEGNLNPIPPLKAPPSDWPKDAWGQFYGTYPRKVGKADAQRALDRIRRAGKISFDRIMGGLRRYLDTDPDPQFIPHPATWLNGERWDDEPSPVRHLGRGPPRRDPPKSAQSHFLDIARDADAELRNSPHDNRSFDGEILPPGPSQPPSRYGGSEVHERPGNHTGPAVPGHLRVIRSVG